VERNETPRGELDSPWKCPAYIQDFGKELARRDTRCALALLKTVEADRIE
jgi:hypothetical protein